MQTILDLIIGRSSPKQCVPRARRRKEKLVTTTTTTKNSGKAKKPSVVERTVQDMLASSEVADMLSAHHEDGGQKGCRRSDAFTKKRVDPSVTMEARRNKKGNFLCGKIASVPLFGRSKGTAEKVGAFLRANAQNVPKALQTLPSGLPLVPSNYDGSSMDPTGSLTAAKTRAAAVVPDDVFALALVVAHAMTMPDAPVPALRSFLRVLCADHLAIEEAVKVAQDAVEADGGAPIEGKKYPGILVFAEAKAKPKAKKKGKVAAKSKS